MVMEKNTFILTTQFLFNNHQKMSVSQSVSQSVSHKAQYANIHSQLRMLMSPVVRTSSSSFSFVRIKFVSNIQINDQRVS